MNSEVKKYAEKILADAGCDEYSYGGTDGETIVRDLKDAFPDGMPFPYVDVANAIMEMSKVHPIVRSPWSVVWDTEHCCDGFGRDSLEAAQEGAIDTLVNWMAQERMEWADVFNPTEEELERYNHMIYNCSAHVAKYDPMTDEYEEFWWPDEDEIGWKELTMEDIKKMNPA